ncbi:putative bicyclomycin resistance protein [Botrytis fragariae]|uniref:Putative bicyclomycin resistance protein n=1 Tax=Botrytis fragariae TaxID=1964551 RepID=A0A8H6AIA3_9HELO|nr:putative bicyclomycin resistance protein [Botrytis fragariae]KAF5868117.1 putative bicyclomycin resistance protein [Botrytis fragariae]
MVVFEEAYGFKSGLVGLTYFSLGVDSMVGLVFFGYLSDHMMKNSTAEVNALAAEACQEPPVIVPILSTTLVGVSNIFVYMCINLHLVGTFIIFAASALSANPIFRSVRGAVLSLCGR